MLLSSVFQGRFGLVTDSLTGDSDALSFFSFSRNNADTNQIDVFLTNSLVSDPSGPLQYTVCTKYSTFTVN